MSRPQGYENLSARPQPSPEDDERTSSRPPAGTPLFEGGPEQKARWERARVENPRRPGESLTDWFERFGAIAEGGLRAARQVPLGDRELPARDRVPGEDDGE